MAISASLLPEFDQEMANTRRALERVPDDKFDWKPHEKSWAMGGLATHLANLPIWTVYTIKQDSLDLAPPGAGPLKVEPKNTRQEILENFDKNVADARAALVGASDEELLKPWTLLKGGVTLMTLPKIAVLRGFVMNHIIHHRGQFTVYLRLNDIPVPSIYGPSADEVTM
ncbi:MAG TPA: DinB family protein [Blastocatellia bacterium]|nr:DinB family protein [Blastocatellia bacterium]